MRDYARKTPARTAKTPKMRGRPARILPAKILHFIKESLLCEKSKLS